MPSFQVPRLAHANRGLRLMAAEELHQETSWHAPGTWGCARQVVDAPGVLHFVPTPQRATVTHQPGWTGFDCHHGRYGSSRGAGNCSMLAACRREPYAGVLRTRAALEITDARRLPPRVPHVGFPGIREVLGHERESLAGKRRASARTAPNRIGPVIRSTV